MKWQLRYAAVVVTGTSNGSGGPPDAVRNTIYVQPLDNFETASGPSLQNLSQFAEAFFTYRFEHYRHPLCPAGGSLRIRIRTRISNSLAGIYCASCAKLACLEFRFWMLHRMTESG